MYKKIFFHSIISGILAAIAANIYDRIYYFATEADFSKVLNAGSITAINILFCMIAGLVFWGLTKWLKKKGEIVFNFLFSILSFAMVMIPISLTLPLKIQFPELFPGLAVPMVFFPAIAWYTINPLFNHTRNQGMVGN
ncbi:MAG: hypothetical protein ABI760_14545 [Ferruginibacter sp.]